MGTIYPGPPQTDVEFIDRIEAFLGRRVEGAYRDLLLAIFATLIAPALRDRL